MATQKKNTVYILLSIALIWNYGGMSSNVESDCEFDSPMTYDESSDCPNGATGLMLCEPGQVKIKPCISADEDTTDICRACTGKFFQANFNRCTICRSCSDCGTNERVQTHCTTTSDTVCISIFTEPSTTSQESTTELHVGSTTAAELKVITEKTGQKCVPDQGSSLDSLHVALIVVCLVLTVVCLALGDPENPQAPNCGGSDKRSATPSAVKASDVREMTPRSSTDTSEERNPLMAKCEDAATNAASPKSRLDADCETKF
ncbi:uncharacterized protein [Diadema antillarum]|uniref:uncharacterized protein n=1 Tax=Diadema antillarum TaxID=105358 RepID=UPI003A8469C7